MSGAEGVSGFPGPTSRHFVSQRLPLHYLDWGNEAAPPLVLLHGGLDHARSWDAVACAFRDDWHVVCPDLRGHGDSAWSPDGDYAMPTFVADLAQLARQLDDRPLSIVAHSLGGAVSLRFASLYPERVARIVAVEGIGVAPMIDGAAGSRAAAWRRWMEERHALSARRPRRYADLDDACARMAQVSSHLSPEQVRHLTTHALRRNEDGSYGWKYDNYVRAPLPADVTAEELRSLWAAIACPTWLVHGAESWAAHPDEGGRAACFRAAAVTSYERAGHWVQHDRADAFITDLRRFLAGEGAAELPALRTCDPTGDDD